MGGIVVLKISIGALVGGVERRGKRDEENVEIEALEAEGAGEGGETHRLATFACVFCGRPGGAFSLGKCNLKRFFVAGIERNSVRPTCAERPRGNGNRIGVGEAQAAKVVAGVLPGELALQHCPLNEQIDAR